MRVCHGLGSSQIVYLGGRSLPAGGVEYSRGYRAVTQFYPRLPATVTREEDLTVLPSRGQRRRSALRMSPTGCRSGSSGANTGIASFEVRSPEELDRRIPEAECAGGLGLWRDDLARRAAKLRFIQSIGAGTGPVRARGPERARHPPRQRRAASTQGGYVAARYGD